MRFIAFGCSHTWGCGILSGDDGIDPSPVSWVQVLSKKFNVPVLNLSHPGGSNLLTLDTIRNHDWQPDDIALIQWTYFERSTVFVDTTEKFKHISVGRVDYEKYVKDYYSLYSNYHTDYLDLLHIEHAYLYLKAYNIPTVARFTQTVGCVFPLNGFYSRMLEDFQKPTLQIVADSMQHNTGINSIGADGSHFSSAAHEAFAEEYVSEIANFANNHS